MASKIGKDGELAMYLAPRLSSHPNNATVRLQRRIADMYQDLRLPLYRYTLCLGVRPQEADEIGQETFLRLFNHLRAGGSEENLRGWVFRVAHNLAFNWRKENQRFKSEEEQRESGHVSVDPGLNPEELVLRKEQIGLVLGAIDLLPARQRQCLHLRAEGFRYKEIAEILGVQISTVNECLRRALERLMKVSQ